MKKFELPNTVEIAGDEYKKGFITRTDNNVLKLVLLTNDENEWTATVSMNFPDDIADDQIEFDPNEIDYQEYEYIIDTLLKGKILKEYVRDVNTDDWYAREIYFMNPEYVVD